VPCANFQIILQRGNVLASARIRASQVAAAPRQSISPEVSNEDDVSEQTGVASIAVRKGMHLH